MKFLNEQTIVPQLRELTKSSSSIRIAVAFWGAGASEQLGLAPRAADSRIICNLKSGGTNPDEIRAQTHKMVGVTGGL